MPRNLCSILILFALGSRAFCTTLIFRLYDSRILVAADTRAETATGNVIGGVAQLNSDTNDRMCKILLLNHIGFAVTGAIDYRKAKDALDSLENWNALDDAKTASNAHPDNLKVIAEDWARHSVMHYQAFYDVAPQRVAKIAESSSHVFEVGLFFGWQNDAAQLIVEIIQFDPNQSIQVSSSEKTMVITENELSTNNHTQELVEGTSPMAKGSALMWAERSKKLDSDKLAWKHLQFLIEETSTMDKSVSRESDILEIPVKGEPDWIVTSGCRR